MDSLAVKKSDKNVLMLASSSLSKLYDCALLLASLLVLGFQIETRTGSEALFTSKFSFAVRTLLEIIPKGNWLESLPFLIPFSTFLAGWILLGRTDHFGFDRITNRFLAQKNLYFLTLQKKVIPFETIKGILLTKTRGQDAEYLLLMEEGSGRKTPIEKSGDREKLRSLAKKIQEISFLPLNQKLYP